MFLNIGILFVFVKTFSAERLHSAETECPPHLPYYTSVGCVYECPHNFVKNGSSCVPSCQDWFVTLDGYCQQSCENNSFVRTTVKSFGQDVYLEKQCLSSCKYGEFILNRTCLNACPVDVNYVSNNLCVTECPNDTPFMLNFTINGLLYHTCLTNCPQYEENKYCTYSCSDGRVKFLSSCTESCPESHQIIFQGECLNQCGGWMFNVNNTCRVTCTEELPYVYGQTCVSRCPTEAPYLCDENCTINHAMCLINCPSSSFIQNNTCVSRCEFLSFNKRCFSKCPVDAPYTRNVTECTNNNCFTLFWYIECMANCEPGKFLINSTRSCVDICPENTFIYNFTCFDSCPINVPYMRNNSVSFTISFYEMASWWDYVRRSIDKREDRMHCVESCEAAQLQLNNTCFHACPLKFRGNELYYFNETCLKNCPDSHPYITKTTKMEHCSHEFYCEKVKLYYECTKVCPENTLLNGYYCVNFCSDPLLNNGGTCVKSCPNQTYGQKYEVNSFEWQMNTYLNLYYRETLKDTAKKCVAQCSESVAYNNSCERHCPFESMYITQNVCHNQTCLTSYKYNSSLGIECVDRCPSGTFIYENMCVNVCPGDMVGADNTCLEVCPSSKPFTYRPNLNYKLLWAFNNLKKWSSEVKEPNMICYDKCPTGALFKQSCVSQCPNSYRFIYDGQCSSSCPDSHFLNNTNEGAYCLSRCPANMVLGLNRTCVDLCTDPVKYNQDDVCVAHCQSPKPFGAKEKVYGFLSNKNIFKCISKCEDGKVLKSDEEVCIYESSCENNYFVFDGQCLIECPEGYSWFFSCFHRNAAITLASVLSALWIIYILRSFRLFNDARNFIKASRNSKKVQDELASQYTSFFPMIPKQQVAEMNVTVSGDQVAIQNIELQTFDNKGYVC